MLCSDRNRLDDGEEKRGEERSSNYWRTVKTQQRMKEESRGEKIVRTCALESRGHGKNQRKERRCERKREGTRAVIG